MSFDEKQGVILCSNKYDYYELYYSYDHYVWKKLPARTSYADSLTLLSISEGMTTCEITSPTTSSSTSTITSPNTSTSITTPITSPTTSTSTTITSPTTTPSKMTTITPITLITPNTTIIDPYVTLKTTSTITTTSLTNPYVTLNITTSEPPSYLYLEIGIPVAIASVIVMTLSIYFLCFYHKRKHSNNEEFVLQNILNLRNPPKFDHLSQKMFDDEIAMLEQVDGQQITKGNQIGK